MVGKMLIFAVAVIAGAWNINAAKAQAASNLPCEESLSLPQCAPTACATGSTSQGASSPESRVLCEARKASLAEQCHATTLSVMALNATRSVGCSQSRLPKLEWFEALDWSKAETPRECKNSVDMNEFFDSDPHSSYHVIVAWNLRPNTALQTFAKFKEDYPKIQFALWSIGNGDKYSISVADGLTHDFAFCLRAVVTVQMNKRKDDVKAWPSRRFSEPESEHDSIAIRIAALGAVAPREDVFERNHSSDKG